jgi:hypothetical protein
MTMYVIVDSDKLTALLNFIANAPLPMGRDKLVQDVLENARPASVNGEVEAETEKV